MTTPMLRPPATALLAATLLAACQVSAPATRPAPTPAPSASQAAEPGVRGPSGATPTPVPTPSPTATPAPEPRRGIGIPFRGDPGIPVGKTVTLTGMPNSDATTLDGPLTWRLDPASATRARLDPLPEDQCRVTVLAPGAIRVIAASPTREGEILLAGVATPAPGTLDPAFPTFRTGGPLPLDGVWVIRSPLEWARYWEASIQAEPYYSATIPQAPEIDWTQQSIVLLAQTSTGGRTPVLTEVDLTGTGRVAAVRPVIWHDAPSPSAQGTSLGVYRTARLPATTVVEYQCEDRIGCPAGPATLPEIDAFKGVEGRALTVGLPLTLPTGWVGEPLTWSIAPRSAGRAEIEDGKLWPLAPGPLVLEVRAGEKLGYVLHAVQPDPPLTRPLAGPYFPQGAHGFTAPAVASDEADWQTLWARLWGPSGPLPSPSPVNGLTPPTAPPPPPPRPAIAFPGRSVLVVDVDVQAHQASTPVVTSIAGGVVQVVVPDARVPGRPDPYAPRTALPGEPVPDLGPFRGPRSVVFDLPALPPVVTVEVAPFPEAAAVR